MEKFGNSQLTGHSHPYSVRMFQRINAILEKCQNFPLPYSLASVCSFHCAQDVLNTCQHQLALQCPRILSSFVKPSMFAFKFWPIFRVSKLHH